MIRISFFKKGGMLTGFESKGHSQTAEYGSDVVCAFVSSACYMTANTVTEVMGLNADAFAEEGYMRLSIKDAPEKAQDILNGMKLHLTELEKEYPENIKVTVTEE
ncbi:MAG: ribosomal-processing cysteine protease Prp [Eubacterium sp.]|nr:ribosomal-processing cysteine protease Prp [Eubacterium sp.]